MKLGIGSKLLGLFGIGSALLVGSALYGVWVAWSSIHTIHHKLDRYADEQKAVLQLQTAHLVEIHDWKNVLLRSDDAATLDTNWSIFTAQARKVSGAAKALLAETIDPRLRTLIEQFHAAHQAGLENYQSGAAASRATGFSHVAGDRAIQHADRPIAKLLDDAVAEIDRNADIIGDQVVAEAEAEVQKSLIVLLLVFLADGAAFVYLIRKYILQPAAQLADGLERLSSGDFSGPVQVASQDEIGKLAKCTQQVNQQLGTLVGEIKTTAVRLAENAKRVAMVSDMTSQGVSTQREETDSASTAVTQLADFLSESVLHAESAVREAEVVDEQVGVVKGAVSEAIAGIHDLAEQVKHCTGAIHLLERDSQQIDSVTQIIRDIAGQTHLLSLNAAIEAAHAGDQGRGFAVVADEISKLAHRTKEATQEINRKIEELQGGAKKAVGTMVLGCERADQTAQGVDKAHHSLAHIATAMTTIREVNGRIVASLGGQSVIAKQVNQTIINISQAAEQTAYSSRQTSLEIMKVADEAAGLHRMVGCFTVPESRVSPPPPQTAPLPVLQEDWLL
ncbi:MAG: methyl-accepting chemotaxis protein [Sulfuricella sp.]|nr:methyl-accepting chemotaxis protein [Sulfuricella sp.]